VDRHDRTAIVERADYDLEFRIVFLNGKMRWIHTVGHPVLSNAGDLEQFVGSSTNITALKSAEQEREKLRQLEADLAHIDRVSTLGEMAASLAHEIKQPISAAITSANSCVEWLAHEPPNLDRARAAAAKIDKYGNRAAEILDRMRSLWDTVGSSRNSLSLQHHRYMKNQAYFSFTRRVNYGQDAVLPCGRRAQKVDTHGEEINAANRSPETLALCRRG
jgi:C4-dicarboxylate-specific signal transduction histidine kinase